jgi:undecaprenyl-diphosphatase
VEWLKAILLGGIEGVTEFLPISSTGHLLIASDLLRFRGGTDGTFEIVIQLGAVLAVLGYYANDLLGQARAVRRDPAVRRLWLGIVLAFLPAAIIGVLLRGWIKAVLFASPTVIAASFIVGGIILIAFERLPRRAPTTTALTGVTLHQALGIGVAQICALIPGVSRSGASIIGGLIGGLDRPTATAFSFYLAIPTLGAATVLDLVTSLDQLTGAQIGQLFVGGVVAFVVAWAALGWLLRYVAHHSLVAFGCYRIVAGLVILGLIWAEVIGR